MIKNFSQIPQQLVPLLTTKKSPSEKINYPIGIDTGDIYTGALPECRELPNILLEV